MDLFLGFQYAAHMIYSGVIGSVDAVSNTRKKMVIADWLLFEHFPVAFFASNYLGCLQVGGQLLSMSQVGFLFFFFCGKGMKVGNSNPWMVVSSFLILEGSCFVFLFHNRPLPNCKS